MSTNEPMTQEQLDVIRGRVESSTWTEADPWECTEDDWDGWCVGTWDSGFGTAYVAKDIQSGGDEGGSDAALIANAPQDLADLLAEVQRLKHFESIVSWRYGDTTDGKTRADMIERAARLMWWQEAITSDYGTWDRLPERARETWRVSARSILDAALGTEEEA